MSTHTLRENHFTGEPLLMYYKRTNSHTCRQSHYPSITREPLLMHYERTITHALQENQYPYMPSEMLLMHYGNALNIHSGRIFSHAFRENHYSCNTREPLLMHYGRTISYALQGKNNSRMAGEALLMADIVFLEAVVAVQTLQQFQQLNKACA